MTQIIAAHPFFRRASIACRTCGRILVPIGIGVLAFALVWREALPFPFPIAFVGINALFVWISWNDLRTRRVPNTVTYPLMAIGIVRALAFRDGGFLIYWGVFFVLWTVRFMGGGDAKLLMGLFGLFPDFRLAQIVAASIMVTGIPYLLFKYRRDWRTVPRTLVWRILSHQLLPSEEEFEGQAVPYAFSFCLAGAVYLLMLVAQR